MKNRSSKQAFVPNRGMRTILTFFLAAILVVSGVPAFAFADDGKDTMAAGGAVVSDSKETSQQGASDQSEEQSETAPGTNTLPSLATADDEPSLGVQAVTVDAAIGMIYVDEATLAREQTQSIAVLLNDESQQASGATLVLREAMTGFQQVVECSTSTPGALLFTFALSADAPLGSYAVSSLSYQLDGIEYAVTFDEPQPNGAFSLVAQTDAANDASMGVKAVSVYSLDASGNMVESNSVDQALNQSGNALGAGVQLRSLLANPASPRSSNGEVVIALDPGHGGYDPGASANGLNEKDINWKIALYCKEEIERHAGYKVFMTRSEDECPTIQERVDRSVAAGASVVVSIHINSATSPDAYGCEVWYPNGSSYNYYLHDEGYDFSQKILAKLEALGLYNRGAKIKDYGVGDAGYPDGSASDYYGVIRYAREASILGVIIEHAFITSPSDADKLRNDAFLKELGIADAQAIMEKFGQVLNISSSVASIGEPITVSPVSGAGFAGCAFNYVWRYGDGWGDWDSTLNSTGALTQESTYQFVPSKGGHYTLYADIHYPDGRVETLENSVEVKYWSFDSITAPDKGFVGLTSTYSPNFTGDTTGLTYNYVWAYEGLWSEGDWSSTVKETGSNTSKTSGSFTPTKPGIYKLFIDAVAPDGYKRTLQKNITVDKSSWELSSVNAPSTATMGTPVEFSPKLTGDAAGLTYNYVWTYEGLWSEGDWSSTVKETGANTKDMSGTFTPTKPGTYQLYVDAVDAYGNKTTKDATVQVGFGWTFDRVSAPASATVGTPVEFSPKLTGDAAGLTYNYVWTFEGRWGADDWSSTVKDTGSNTTAKSGTFTPTKPGTYQLYVDAVDAYGNKTTKDATVKAIGTNIMGASESNASQMARYYVSKSLPYPSVVYASKGAGDLATFCNIVSEEAAAEGVRADVVFCQAMKETGWLQFTGDVKAEQCNFCGLGATGGGNPGLSFESVRMGVRAHVQHLKAYASTDPLVNDCVDPRFTYVTRGIAPTLEELNGRWAVPGNNYGQDIAAMIKEMQKA